MQSLYRTLRLFLVGVCFIAITWIMIDQYSFVFSKDVKGEVIEVERLSNPSAIIGGTPMTPEQMFSTAVLLKTFDGQMYSASSEDRQWAIARKGYCVEARLYPYPPWNLDKSRTYFNARLIRVFDCRVEAPKTWQPTKFN